MAENPIFMKQDKFYFWDEAWVDYWGPFESRPKAEFAYKCYVENLHTNVTRNFFLMKAMGLCMRGGSVADGKYCCDDCDAKFDSLPELIQHGNHYRRFDNWEDFGLLWKWCGSNEWWIKEFMPRMSDKYALMKTIDPNKFADTVYEFLKKEK